MESEFLQELQEKLVKCKDKDELFNYCKEIIFKKSEFQITTIPAKIERINIDNEMKEIKMRHMQVATDDIKNKNDKARDAACIATLSRDPYYHELLEKLSSLDVKLGLLSAEIECCKDLINLITNYIDNL